MYTRFLFFGLFYWCSFFTLNAQSISQLNFSHWYNPKNEVDLKMRIARGETSMWIYYELNTPTEAAEKYTISWERRESYTQKKGVSISQKDSLSTYKSNGKNGALVFTLSPQPWILLAKITHIPSQRTWYYFKLIESIYPAKGWIENSSGIVFESYLANGATYQIRSTDHKHLFVSYYKTDFPQAYPPFTDKAPNPNRILLPDSVFKVVDKQSFTPSKNGLYLFQQDTLSADGYVYRVVPSVYPKFNTIGDLTPPLVFITTPDEYNQLLKVQGNKASFDQIILDIAQNKERAKKLIRSYFQQIELANRYFTSFKEGWKTDRGMIYTIWGIPDELAKNSSGKEIWTYKNANLQFTFVKSGSVYDPDNYVLLRNKHYRESWLSMIDLWRKSRF